MAKLVVAQGSMIA